MAKRPPGSIPLMLMGALGYADCGWFVHPVRGKRPYLNEWQKQASVDVTRWQAYELERQETARRVLMSAETGLGIKIDEKYVSSRGIDPYGSEPCGLCLVRAKRDLAL